MSIKSYERERCSPFTHKKYYCWGDSMINEHKHEAVLNTLGINKKTLIGFGMEAFVYKYDEQRVLKIYNSDMTSASKQHTLKNFYNVLDISNVNIELPQIEQIMEINGTIVTIEKLINGRNMREAIENSPEEKIEKLMKNHLLALLKTRDVNIQGAFKGIKLFHEADVPESNDWYQYLHNLLHYQLSKVEPYLQEYVERFNEKVDALFRALSGDYTGKYTLIHGDFCPENILVNSNCEVTGIIDFGLMTMQGDFLFDVATGWLFFDMYDQYTFDFKTKYLNLVIKTFGEKVKSKIFLYVLLYSIYSVNFYSDDFSDGHADWCIRNLNDQNLWKEVEFDN